jgi:hypothetical protein
MALSELHGIFNAFDSSTRRTEGAVRSAVKDSYVWKENMRVATIRVIGGFRRDTLLPDSTMVFVADNRDPRAWSSRQDSSYSAVIDPVRHWEWPVTIRVRQRGLADTSRLVGYLIIEPEKTQFRVFESRERPGR